MKDSFFKTLEFIVEIDKLKTIDRRTRLIFSDRHENDAEHSYHITLMASLLHDFCPEADIKKTMEMCMVHDIVEIDAGDTFAYDVEGYKTKKEREEKAAQRIFSLLPEDKAKYYKSLFEEFEERRTKEAIFANAMDRSQPIIQNIFNNGGTWNEYDVKWEDLMKRMEPIREFSEELYMYLAGEAKKYFVDADL